MNAQQLKNAILQEAIEGRLVPQDQNDEPASVLLERIRKEKEQLVKEGKLKKKDLEVKPITDEEIPFDIPKGWVWVRWGELGEYKKGPFGSSLTKSMFVPQSEEAVKVYEQKNAIQKDYSLGDYFISKEKYETMTGFTVRPGDIIVSCAGTIGETYLLPPEAPIGIINQALMRAKLHLDSIIPYWLLHFQYVLLIENKLKGSGSAIKNIPPFEVLKAMPVPLPPLAEQKRIVAKIEELLPKVEEYGKAQEALDKLNAELPERLKKSILQEAIEGRLVPQDSKDEPASVLLQRIRKEKEQLVKEGKLKKKDLEVKPIDPDEIPFAIPDSWEWCRLNNVGDIITGGTPSKSELKYYGNEIPFYKPADLEQGINTISSTDSLSVEGFEHSRKLPKNSVLVTCIGSIGKTGLIRKEGTCNQQINAIIPSTIIIPEYLYYCCLSSYFQESMWENSSSTTLAILNKNKFSQLCIPLPPLAEQKRIVAKIEELFARLKNE